MNAATGAARFSRERSRLFLDAPWFGSGAMRLTLTDWTVPDAKAAGMSTDGTRIYVDHTAMGAYSDRVYRTMLAHEAMHCLLLHPFRLGSRDLATANKAADHVVNLALAGESWAELWPGALCDPQYAGMSFEQVYAKLFRKGGEEGTEPGGDEDGDYPQPGLDPAPDPGTQPGDGDSSQPVKPMTADDWQIAGEQAAMVARKAGTMPGDADLAMRAARPSPTDWRAVLARFVEATVPSDYTWSTPNRRYIASGLYLPGVLRENTPALGVVVDTSGSVAGDPALLAAFGAELTAILRDTRPESMTVLYADTRVQHVQTFDPDDGEDILLTPRGGGGTDFQPALDYFSELDTPPACVIYLTDLYAATPTEPDYPVLWAVPEATYYQDAAFGETVRIDPHG